MKSGGSSPGKFLLVLFGSLLSFLIVEAGLRIQARHRYIYRTCSLPVSKDVQQGNWIWVKSPNNDLVYEHRPGYVKDGVCHTDRLGLAAPFNYQLPKRKGIFRVAIVGDSISAGFDLPVNDRYPVVLEDMISKRGLRTEIMNFAVNGYSAFQKVTMLESKTAGFDPDCVVFQYCLEDPVPAVVPLRWFKDREPPLLFAWNLLNTIRQNREDEKLGPWARLYKKESATWKQVVLSLEKLGKLQRETRIPVVFVIFPLLQENWPEYRYAALHLEIIGEARRNGLSVLDLLPVYAQFPAEEVKLNQNDLVHPGRFGHRLAAEAIARFIVEEVRGRAGVSTEI